MSNAGGEWPAGVERLSLENLRLLGIDGDRSLYWDGRRVEIRQRLTLSLPQKVGAALVVVATVLGGIGSATQAVTAVLDSGCARGMWPRWCPKETTARPATPPAPS